ncbi:MAG: hypothetical protein COA44_13925 [Arcobacter sp.]|nr:MAG: hypothetical protein COA44_13925 [Arcobacter sp.]
MNSFSHAFDEDTHGQILIAAKIEDKEMILSYKDDGDGMNIIYNIVTGKLKGSIRVESALKKGTELIILLPNVLKD